MDDRRRKVLKFSGLAVAAWFAGGTALSAQEKGGEEISPSEDLMREHGVLRRVLLIYRYFLNRPETGERMPWEAVSDSADIIKTFIEAYHERLEEQYVFPAVRKAGRLTGLVEVLDEQHHVGRQITARILKIAGARRNEGMRALHTSLASFIRMYEPHAAREDTVLFPALPSAAGRKELKRMGELFEKEEERIFGEHGFEKMVDRVAAIEKSLGLYDLNQFTPKLPL